MIKKLLNTLPLILLAVFFISTNCFAQEQVQQEQPQVTTPQQKDQAQETVLQAEEEKQRLIQGYELLTGYGWSRINAKNDFELKRNYNLFPIILDLSFNLKDLTKRIGINPPMVLEFLLEPYVAYVSSPNDNVEIGNSFLLKLGLVPETWKFQLYAKAGVGMVYMTQHTREQGTQFNFIENGALGAHYFFTKNTALTVEGRMRHLSNAGIKQPNHGINSYFVLAGIAYKY